MLVEFERLFTMKRKADGSIESRKVKFVKKGGKFSPVDIAHTYICSCHDWSGEFRGWSLRPHF